MLTIIFPGKTIVLFILGATQLLKLFSKYKAELVALSFRTDYQQFITSSSSTSTLLFILDV